MVVDNASTDDTPEVLSEEFGGRVEVLTLAVNEGSAGGFHEGMKRAHAGGSELALADGRRHDPAARTRSRSCWSRPLGSSRVTSRAAGEQGALDRRADAPDEHALARAQAP